MWQIIYPRLKKVALFCLSHWTYILWFLLYFMGSFLILSSNRFMDYGEAFITCVVLYMISIAVALTCGEFVQKLLNGVRPPETSWGALASAGQQQLMFYPHQLFFPCLLIVLTILSFHLIGDGLSDALDPKLRQ